MGIRYSNCDDPIIHSSQDRVEFFNPAFEDLPEEIQEHYLNLPSWRNEGVCPVYACERREETYKQEGYWLTRIVIVVYRTALAGPDTWGKAKSAKTWKLRPFKRS